MGGCCASSKGRVRSCSSVSITVAAARSLLEKDFNIFHLSVSNLLETLPSIKVSRWSLSLSVPGEEDEGNDAAVNTCLVGSSVQQVMAGEGKVNAVRA